MNPNGKKETQSRTRYSQSQRRQRLGHGGQSLDGTMTGYWEWFRKDGTKMRSGSFDNGVQVGDWTTYDKNGEVFKVTKMKASQK
jgi:antitoxin component YwqK of YwqJK toxin-antitoxin module